MALTRKTVAVFMGGTSAEREVSLRSGKAIYSALKELGYRAVPIDVGPDICTVINKKKIGLAFLALHGGYGENGSIQGMLEVLGIPYTGSGVLASALAMNKEASKQMFLCHKVPVPRFVLLHNTPGTRKMIQRLSPAEVGFHLPWVVKPAEEGSSVGVSIVRDVKALQGALRVAFRYGTRVMVEKFIPGKEVHIAILNGKVLGGVEVRPSVEFYTYEAKYTAGLTDYVLPPQISAKTYKAAKGFALKAHNALGCAGATRVDLRISTKGIPYVLEVNTIPGMTETSLLPKIAYSAGISFKQLIEEILRGVMR